LETDLENLRGDYSPLVPTHPAKRRHEMNSHKGGLGEGDEGYIEMSTYSRGIYLTPIDMPGTKG